MENFIHFRDEAFWWIGNWALFTGLDAALIAIGMAWGRRLRRKQQRTESGQRPPHRPQLFDQDAPSAKLWNEQNTGQNTPVETTEREETEHGKTA